MPRILLIGSRKTTLDSLIATIEPYGHTIVAARNQREALKVARNTPPDVIVFDTTSTRIAVDRLSSLLGRHVEAPLITILREGQPVGNEERTFTLVKPYSAKELMSCIKAALEQPRHLHCGPIELDLRARSVCMPHLDQPCRLPPKQFALLRLLMTHHSHVVTRECMMREVWNTAFVEDTRTLDVHIRWLREIIEPDPSTPIYLHTIRGTGYCLSCER